MNQQCYKFIGENLPHFKSEEIFFNSLALDYELLNKSLSPIIQIICQRIESTYKSPTKITYIGVNSLSKNTLSDYMQFDDVCIKLWHIDSGIDIFIILGARLARTLLIRFLSTSLIDDKHSSLFSPTEKGIFSFIVARLLFDLKNVLVEKMPNLKLTGIYHCQDETVSDVDIKSFGVFNFSLTFATNIYPVILTINPKLLANIKTKRNSLSNLLPRCGHLKRLLIFTIKKLQISLQAMEIMSLGDLIMFDHYHNPISDNALCGPICATWQDIIILGKIDVTNNAYRFLIQNNSFHHREDNIMEELEISHSADIDQINPSDQSKKLAELAKNIRISLSIELARLPMTLKELCDVREGEIIDLHRKIDDPLEMVVENKVIGYCQPVQIDGRFGIRVIKTDSAQQN